MGKLMLNSAASIIVDNQKGFTLIEIFIAIVLLTVGLMGTAVLTTGVVRGNLGSRNMTTATAIAQSCLEENRRVGFTNAGAGSSTCLSGSVNVTQGSVIFARALTVTPTPAINSTIKTLTVTVTWSEGAVGSKSLTLTTIIAAS
jgi:prepilin-type N-terminal cleavage/methylation domain-containing protein